MRLFLGTSATSLRNCMNATTPMNNLSPEELAAAFTAFEQSSRELAGAYTTLQEQVDRLTRDLATANARLKQELEEKDALSRQLEALLQLEREAERNRRLTAMGEMAAKLAHQLRTPLATALLYAGQLEGHGEMSEAERARATGKIIAKMQQVEAMVRGMLLFVKQGLNEKEALDLLPLLQQLCHEEGLRCERHGIRFEADLPLRPLPLLGNASELTGALQNLLDNAREAGAGDIRLEAGASDDGWATLIISDNGCGMNTESLEHAFEPFHTSKKAGTGLGLAVVRGVVSAHGGEIEVDSTPGAGTEFRIHLPLSHS